MIKPPDSGRQIDCIVQLEAFDSVSSDLFSFLGIAESPLSLPKLNASGQYSLQLPSTQLSALNSYLAPDLELHQRLRANGGIIINP
jgi:hypothetical protein